MGLSNASELELRRAPKGQVESSLSFGPRARACVCAEGTAAAGRPRDGNPWSRRWRRGAWRTTSSGASAPARRPQGLTRGTRTAARQRASHDRGSSHLCARQSRRRAGAIDPSVGEGGRDRGPKNKFRCGWEVGPKKRKKEITIAGFSQLTITLGDSFLCPSPRASTLLTSGPSKKKGSFWAKVGQKSVRSDEIRSGPVT